MERDPLAVASFCEAFQNTVAAGPDEVALRTPGGAVEVTWGEFAARVRAIANGLATLGVGRGDTVALMMVNRPDFNIIDTAALHVGATPFSIYNTSAPEQIAYLFSSAGNRVVLCESQFVDGIVAARGETDVEHIVCIDGEHPDALALAELEQADPPAGFDFEQSYAAEIEALYSG